MSQTEREREKNTLYVWLVPAVGCFSMSCKYKNDKLFLLFVQQKKNIFFYLNPSNLNISFIIELLFLCSSSFTLKHLNFQFQLFETFFSAFKWHSINEKQLNGFGLINRRKKRANTAGTRRRQRLLRLNCSGFHFFWVR